MNYIDIDFNRVPGYLEPAKEIFERVYKIHNLAQGLDLKEEWHLVLN